jgi:hypothetical protein
MILILKLRVATSLSTSSFYLLLVYTIQRAFGVFSYDLCFTDLNLTELTLIRSAVKKMV